MHTSSVHDVRFYVAYSGGYTELVAFKENKKKSLERSNTGAA